MTDAQSPSRRLLHWTGRGLLALLLLFILLALVGFVWERIASARFAEDYPAPGRLVTLDDGRMLHFIVKGEGEPTLVLQSGGGSGIFAWQFVFDRLAESTRVIAYDRPGYGWSDPAPDADVETVIADLETALGEIEPTAPVVLVGHSLGGIYVRHHALKHPDRVVGLVLVDSSHEQQMQRMPAAVTDAMGSMQMMMSAAEFASRFGMLRALHALGMHPSLPADTSPKYAAMINRSSVLQTMLREIQNMQSRPAQLSLEALSLTDLPLLVLSATEANLPPQMMEHSDEVQAVWREMQAELVALSSNTRHVPVPEAGHDIMVDRPDVVVDEIVAMVEAIRAGEPYSAEVDEIQLIEPFAVPL